MLAFTPTLPLRLSAPSPGLSLSPLRKPRRQAPPSTLVAIQQRTPPSTAPTTPRDEPRDKSSRVTAPTPAANPTSAPQPPNAPVWLLSYLKANKHAVDNALDTCLPAENVHTRTILNSMRYSLLAGGKRIRPILTIAAYQMFAGRDADLTPVMPTALAVEIIHTMSLIHDDLPSMDNDDFRRGKPTNHKVYGEDIAILAGDALLSYAFEIVARNTPSDHPRRVLDVVGLLGESVGAHGLAGGQVMDLENEGRSDVSIDTLTWIHTHKTATLLRVSCAAGAILGGATPEDVERITEFAVKIGLAFQIADDVLDVTQSTEVLGKTAGKDEATDKATYPRLLGLDGSRAQAEKLISEAKASLAPYGSRADTLYALADFIINRQN